jgi:type IV pilus assembly protein PilM
LVVSGVQDRLAPLQAWLFPRRVYLQLDDQALTALALNGRRIAWLERLPLPQGLCQDGEPLLVEALGDLIGDLLIERGWVGARLRAVLPAAATEWRLVQWPAGQCSPGEGPAEPEQLLRERQEELGFRLPLPSADLLAWTLQQEPPTSLVVAVRPSLLDGWIATINGAGVALDGLEAAPLCLCRAVEPLLEGAPADQLTAVLQLEPEGSGLLLLLRSGLPVFEQALPSSSDPEALTGQLQRCIAYWRRQDADAGALALLVHGSLAAAEAPVAWLAAALDCSCGVLDPLALGWLQGEPAPGAPQGVELAALWGLAAAELP